MKNIGIIKTIVLLFLLSLVTIASSISLITYVVSKNILQDNTQLTSTQTLKESENAFTIYLKSLSQQVDLLTRKNELKLLDDLDNLEDNLENAKNSLTAALKTTPGSVHAYYATKTGHFISAYPSETNDTIKYIFSAEENIDSTNTTWYQNALLTEERLGVFAHYTEPYTSELNGLNIITVSQCVKSKGEIVGVVAMDIAFEEVFEFIDNIGLLNTGTVYLVNPQGDILVTPSNSSLNITQFSELPFWEELNTTETVSLKKNIDNYQYYLTSFTDPITNWKLIGLINEGEITEDLSKLLNYIIVAVIIGLLISLLILIPMVKEIKRRFGLLTHSINQVAKGNFTQQPIVEGKDEFHQLSVSINKMISSVAGLITNVDKASTILFDTTKYITNITNCTQETSTNVKIAIEEISIGTTHQAESLQDITEQVDTLAKQLEATRNYTADVKDMSSETQALSTSGLDMLKMLGEKSTHSQNISRGAYDLFKEMIESIHKINFISDTIISITDQTSLLSLNASIEAARAGESGKGFAVVADEIRKLSEASKKSTDEIKSIVDEIHRAATQANNSLEESNTLLTEQGTALLDTETVFNNILASVEKLITNIHEIDRLNNNMVDSKNTVIKNMDEMAAISEETASSAEEVTASTLEVSHSMDELMTYTTQLTDAAENLKENLKNFKLD